MQQYLDLMRHVLEHGARKTDRTGTGEVRSGSNMGKGQIVAADYTMSPSITFSQKGTSGIGGVIVRFRIGPMPADFAQRGLQLFMKDIAPALREKTLATV